MSLEVCNKLVSCFYVCSTWFYSISAVYIIERDAIKTDNLSLALACYRASHNRDVCLFHMPMSTQRQGRRCLNRIRLDRPLVLCERYHSYLPNQKQLHHLCRSFCSALSSLLISSERLWYCRVVRASPRLSSASLFRYPRHVRLIKV